MDTSFDISQLWEGLLKSVPLWAVIWFLISRAFKKADRKTEAERAIQKEKEAELKKTLNDMKVEIHSINLKLAGFGVEEVKKALTDLMKKDFEHESKIEALFRIVDKPQRKSDP